MKTILSKYTSVVLCSMIVLFSCSKDDGADPGPDLVKKAALVLTTSATEITVAQAVTFEVTADGKAIDADIYVDNTKISGTTHTFEVTGTYTAIAKKEGYTDSKGVEVTVKAEMEKVATATFTKMNIAAYPTTFIGNYYDRISIMNEHIYVMEDENKKFRRYSLSADLWENLDNESSLYSGIAGYLTHHKEANNKDVLVFLGGSQGKLNIYYPSEYPDASLKDSWTSESVMLDDELGERGAASDGEHIYFMGNGRYENLSLQIDRYVPTHDLWEERIGYLPEKIDGYTQAVSADKKLFIAGLNMAGDNVLYVYDLKTQKTKSKPVPPESALYNLPSWNSTLVVYQDYLLYMLPTTTTSVVLFVYDLKKEQWLENSIKIEEDLFSSPSDNASLLLSSSGKIYAAGTRAGDFVLYEVDFKVTEE